MNYNTYRLISQRPQWADGDVFYNICSLRTYMQRGYYTKESNEDKKKRKGYLGDPDFPRSIVKQVSI